MENAVDRVAAKVKRWRQEAGLSLQEVANRSGVSPSTIHKIEHRHTVPTIAVVLKLVHGLGKQASELFEEPHRESPATHIPRREQAELTGSGGTLLRTLAGNRDYRSMGIWKMVQPAGTQIGYRPAGQDKGEIVLYLEDGKLTVEVDGVNYELETGDSLHFAACHSYTWRNSSHSTAVIMVLSSASDSVQPTLAAHLQPCATETGLNSTRHRQAPPNGLSSVAASS